MCQASKLLETERSTNLTIHFYFHVNGSIRIAQKIDFEIRPDLGCMTLKTSRKMVLDNPSVRPWTKIMESKPRSTPSRLLHISSFKSALILPSLDSNNRGRFSVGQIGLGLPIISHFFYLIRHLNRALPVVTHPGKSWKFTFSPPDSAAVGAGVSGRQGVSAPVYLGSPLNESDTSATSGGSPTWFPKKSSAWTVYHPLQSEGHVACYSLSRS